MNGIVVQIHPLDEHRPVGRFQGRQTFSADRAFFQGPFLTFPNNVSRLNLLAFNHVQQGRSVDQGLHARDGLPNEQGFLLPMAFHELSRRQSRQQDQGCIFLHHIQFKNDFKTATILRWILLLNVWSN